jgi:hypothetical protein
MAKLAVDKSVTRSTNVELMRVQTATPTRADQGDSCGGHRLLVSKSGAQRQMRYERNDQEKMAKAHLTADVEVRETVRCDLRPTKASAGEESFATILTAETTQA